MLSWILLGLLGLCIGSVLALGILKRMMKRPKTRIWLSDWVNWSNNALPKDCHQLVRHGKWIARHTTEDDA
jgi:hypothetical protein